jgi:hypothetical protein
MDLKDFAPKSDEIVVEIKHPINKEPLMNDDGTPMTIVIYAQHSKVYKKVQRELINKRLKEAQESGSKEIDYEQLEEAALELMVKSTKSWNITYEGKKPKLTEAKARQIYDEVFWIKAQIEEAAAASLDFMKA